MKKFAFLLLILNVHFSYGAVKISPELDQFMVLRPEPEEHFNKNAYVGWLGINHAGDDWLTISRDIFNYNDHILNEKMKQGRVANIFYLNRIFRIFNLPKNSESFDDHQAVDLELASLKDYLKDNQQLLKFVQRPMKNKQYAEVKDYFPCREYLNKGCLQEIKKQETYIRTLIKENKTLLSRYRELMLRSEMNYVLFYNDFNMFKTIKASPHTTRLYQLNLADAALDIMNHDYSNGLDKLVLARKWIDLNFREQSLPLASHIVVYTSYTQYLDQTMNALLDSGLLNKHLKDKRLEMILKPYPSNIGQKLYGSLVAELMQNFKAIAYPYLRVYVDAPQNQQLSAEEDYIALSYFQEKTVLLPVMLLARLEFLDLNKDTDNWRMARELIGLRELVFKNSNQDKYPFLSVSEGNNKKSIEARKALTDWYINFFDRLNMRPEEVLSYLNTKYSSVEFYNEYYNFLQVLLEKNKKNIRFTAPIFEELLKAEVSPDYIPIVRSLISYSDFQMFWIRLNEQQNYHRLVYLKYLIMKDNIKPNQVPAFLKSMGNLAVNTITQKSYQYDIKSKKLYTPLPIENKYLPVNIKDAKFDNRLIKDFEVQVP